MAPASTRNRRGGHRQEDIPLRRRAGVGQPRSHAGSRAPNIRVTSFSSAPPGARCSRKGYFIPIIGRTQSAARRLPPPSRTAGAPTPIASRRPLVRSPIAAANGEPAPRPSGRGPRPGAGELETTISSSDNGYGPAFARVGEQARRGRAPGPLACRSARGPSPSALLRRARRAGREDDLVAEHPTHGLKTFHHLSQHGPVSEIHQAPNAAFSDDCCSARTRASPNPSPEIGNRAVDEGPRKIASKAELVRCPVGKRSARWRSIFAKEPSNSEVMLRLGTPGQRLSPPNWPTPGWRPPARRV